MSFSQFTIFSKNTPNNHAKQKSFGQYLSDTFIWLYEHSPINFASITGMHHPSIQRLTGNPLLGRALEVAKDADGLAKEMEKLADAAKKDPMGRAYESFGPNPTLLLTRPEDIAQVFVHNDNNVDRGKLLDAFAKLFGKSNLFTISKNEAWKEKRENLVKWILKPEGLSNLVQPMQKIIDEFIVNMAEDEGRIASLEAFMVSLTMDVFARTGLASEPLKENSQKISDAFGKALEVASLPMNTVWIKLDEVLRYIGISASKYLNKDRDQLQKILKENFFDLNKENLLNKPNILQSYIQESKNHAFEGVSDDVGLFLLAGHETTSRLLQFVIILLAQHDNVLEKLRAEIASNRPANNQWTYDDLKKLKYLEQVIKETLRLYPPIPIIPRMVIKSFVLADIPVCKTKEDYQDAMKNRDQTQDIVLHPGTGVNIAPWFTHRLESLYENPTKFDPDRFEINYSISSNNNYSWIPFGIGERKCPGNYFAIQEAKLVLIEFVEKYDFKPSCKGAKLFETTIRGTLKHKGEIQLEVTPRQETTIPRYA